MQALGADMADELLDVGDVVLEPERAGFQRHHACIHPIGHIDLVVAQQGAHGVAQQRGVVAGQRRNHEHGGLLLHLADQFDVVAETLEAQQPAERLAQHFAFDDRQRMTIDLDIVERPGRLFVFLAQTVEQLVAGGHALGARERCPQAVRVGKHLGVRLGLMYPGG